MTWMNYVGMALVVVVFFATFCTGIAAHASSHVRHVKAVKYALGILFLLLVIAMQMIAAR